MSRADRDRALRTCASNPGAILATGDNADRRLPAGIAAAPPLARGLLAALAEGTAPLAPAELTGAEYGAYGIAVVGGFAEPTTGRANIVAALRAELQAAEQQKTAAEREQRLAGEAEQEAGHVLAAAKAAAEHRDLIANVEVIE